MFYRQDLFENRDIAKAFKNQYQFSFVPQDLDGIQRHRSVFHAEIQSRFPNGIRNLLAGSMDEELAPELLIRLWSNGGKIWDKHFNVCLNTPENAKAFRTILDTLNYTPGSPLRQTSSRRSPILPPAKQQCL